MNTYPQFYQNGFQCIRRDSDTVGYLVEIPQPSRIGIVDRVRLSMINKDGFDLCVRNMRPATAATYEQYLTIYQLYKSKQHKAKLATAAEARPATPSYKVAPIGA